MDARKNAQEMQRAEKVTEWSGPVWWGDAGGGLGNGYYHESDELVDEIRENLHDPLPTYVFLSKSKPVCDCVSIDLIEKVLYANAWSEFDLTLVVGLRELHSAIQTFRVGNEKLLIYHRDPSRVIHLRDLIDELDYQELLKETREYADG